MCELTLVGDEEDHERRQKTFLERQCSGNRGSSIEGIWDFEDNSVAIDFSVPVVLV